MRLLSVPRAVVPILSFHLSRLVAQTVDVTKKATFRNLAYSCPTCDSGKSDETVPHPARTLTAGSVSVHEDGTIVCHTKQLLRIVRVLGLDSSEHKEFRRLIIDIIAMAASTTSGKHKELFKRLMGYPHDIPSLSRKTPSKNSRKPGIQESAFERRKRGELSDVY